MGGKYDMKPETTNKIMDSFGVSTSGPSVQQPVQIQQQIIPQLKTAPKWMKRPCGVSFGVNFVSCASIFFSFISPIF